MTLRAAAGDPKQAAIAVCRSLEDEIGLDGNGWFDDDDDLRALLTSTTGDERAGKGVRPAANVKSHRVVLHAAIQRQDLSRH